MDVLITGICGFEGSNMALRFEKLGYNVVGLDLNKSIRVKELDRFKIVEGDIRDSKTVEPLVKKANAVCHLAGQVSHLYGQEDPKFDLDVNCNGILTILEAIRKHNPKCQLLFASSRSVYGFPKYMPIDEKHQTWPIDAYGVSKLASERYCTLYNYHHGLRTTIFRQANLFGPRQQVWTSDFQMISWIFRCVKLGEEFTFYGDGEQTRDFLYIDDCVAAYQLALEYPERAYGQILNLGGHDYITWNRLIEICGEVTGNEPKVEYVDYPALRLKLENPHSHLSYFQAKQVLGWTPLIGVKEGVRRMNEFFDGETIKSYVESQER